MTSGSNNVGGLLSLDIAQNFYSLYNISLLKPCFCSVIACACCVTYGQKKPLPFTNCVTGFPVTHVNYSVTVMPSPFLLVISYLY